LGVFEGKGLQRLYSGLEVKEANSRLHLLCELGGGPELLHESVCQILVTTCIGGQHAVQKIGAFLTGGVPIGNPIRRFEVRLCQLKINKINVCKYGLFACCNCRQYVSCDINELHEMTHPGCDIGAT
jgi:hypothetical protein